MTYAIPFRSLQYFFVFVIKTLRLVAKSATQQSIQCRWLLRSIDFVKNLKKKKKKKKKKKNKLRLL